MNVNDEMLLKDAYFVDKELFKYHEQQGHFATYDEARDWLRGLSTLKGQFVILEMFEKK